MDTVKELLSNPIVTAVIAGLVVLIAVKGTGASDSSAKVQPRAAVAVTSSGSAPAAKKKKAKSKPKKKTAAAAAPVVVPEPKVEEPEEEEELPPVPAANGKKKKKKKAAKDTNGAAPAPAPKAKPAPAPAPPPPPVVEPPAETTTGKKKKKKKKNKSNKENTTATEANAAATDDSDDDALMTFAKGSRAPKKKAEDDGWNTIPVKRSNKPAPVAAEAVEPEKDGSVTLTIRPDDLPVLIGPKGATIQQIQTTTGATLDLDKRNQLAPAVKISSSDDAKVAAAVAQVQTLLAEHQAKSAHTVTLSGTTIKGSDGVKAIIGRGGSTIQKIQNNSGCQLKASIDAGTVVITGPSLEAVTTAETLCKNAVFGELNVTVDLQSRSMVMAICGKNFAALQQLQKDTGARLDVAKGGFVLTISGDTANVESAQKIVQHRLALYRGMTMTIEAGKIGIVIGPGGSNLKQIQDRTGAQIEIREVGDGTADCKIVGDPKAVKEAQIAVEKSLAGEIELKPGEGRITVQLGVGASAVIGKGGSTIAELEKKYSVKLNVHSETGECNIVGKKEKLAKAKEAVEAIALPVIQKVKEEAKLREQAAQLAVEAANNGGSAWEATEEDETGW